MRIKIFGERNTGTNALRLVLQKNSKSKILPGTIEELGQQHSLQINLMRKLKINENIIERTIDRIFQGRPINEQWKHTATVFPNHDLPIDTHYIFTVRHPASWLISLYKNPYHIKTKKPETLLDFHRMDWHLLQRDNLGIGHVKPIELYEKKLISYVEFIERLEKQNLSYSIVKFEEFINNQEKIFLSLNKYLDEPAPEFQQLMSSTKSQSKNLEYYKSYYSKEMWRNEISEELIQQIIFDKNLLEIFNYNI